MYNYAPCVASVHGHSFCCCKSCKLLHWHTCESVIPSQVSWLPDQEFVYALMAASKRATREDRLRLIFAVFDVDSDGVVSPEDLELMVRQLAGSSLS